MSETGPHRALRSVVVVFIAVSIPSVVAILAGCAAEKAPKAAPAVSKIVYRCPSDKRDWLDPESGGVDESVVVSSSVPSRIYVEDENTSLFVGEGERNYHWRKLSARTPGGLEVSAGNKRDVLFARLGGIFKSPDMGRSWKELVCIAPDDESYPDVNDIAVPATDPRTIYLAMATPMHFEKSPPESGGMYRSTSDGASWTRFTHYYPATADTGPPDYPNLDAQAIVVNPRSTKAIYLSTITGGILVSRDGGDSWYYNAIKEGPAKKSAHLFLTTIALGAGTHPSLWVVTSDETVYRGDEFGRHWTRIEGLSKIADVITDQRNPKVVLVRKVGPDWAPDEGTFLRTVDGGKHWSRVTGFPRNLQSLVIQPLNNTYYALSANRVYRSQNGGVTWTKLPPLPK